MSGNPFRKQPAEDGEQAGKAAASKKKVKKVQFVSPVSSPQEPPSHPRFPSLEELDDQPKSPPPKGTEFDNIDTKALLRGDLTAGGTIDLTANQQQEDASAASTPLSPAPPPIQLNQPPPGRRGPPANPFARTLATMEQDSAGKNTGDADKKKAAMDVDAFKRLLLTGKADAPASPEKPEPEEAGIRMEESPALKVPGHDTPQDDSDSSLEDASSESTVTEEEDSGKSNEDEKDNEVGPIHVSKGSEPQTVSFDDFDQDLEPSIVASEDGTAVSEATSRSRSESDLDKPLPQLPSDSAEGAEHAVITHQQSPPSQQKKPNLPPPPPSARRKGQPAVVTISRSSSNVDTTAPPMDGQDAQSAPSSSRPKPPPPRAPAPRITSRDAKRLSELPDQGTSSTDSVPTQSTIDTSASEASTSTKLKPPPPPSRHSSKPSQSTLKRTPSSSSSITQRKVSPAVLNAAPPPPPRRRGEGKRNSLDGTSAAANAGNADSKRSSVHSFESGRRDSVSSLQRVAEDEGASKAKAEADAKASAAMLADLDAFQKEVDALRAKALAGK